MLEQIKKILLDDLTKERTEYAQKKDAISYNLSNLRSNLWQLEGEQTRGITVRGNFSFWEKLITRRSDYKKFKAQSKRFAKLPQLISKAKEELAQETEKVEQTLETSGINKALERIRKKEQFIQESETLCELGVHPISAIEFLQNHGIQPVLTDADRKVSSHPRDYSSKSSLIGVHKTNYAPTANMIKSSKDSNVKLNQEVVLNGTSYKYSFNSARDTVHMAMNDEVSSHTFGSWDNCKYAVLIPFADIPNDKIGCAAPMDTFTHGSIELSENTWILCPKSEVAQLKVFNPKAHIVGYEGENVKGFSKPFLTQLGYRAEDVGMWNWLDSDSAVQFNQLMNKEGIQARYS